MKILLLISTVFLTMIVTHGQTTFQKTYGGTAHELGRSVQQTFDGGFILSGYTLSYSAGNADVYLIKIDGSGNILWSKSFGGTGAEDGWSVQQTNDGGFIITGVWNAGANKDDVYLIKTDGGGNALWTKTYGGIMADRANYARQTTDGGFIITGYTFSFGAGDADAYLIKTDGNGNALWTKTFGGTNGDMGSCVQQTGDGGFIIAGHTYSFSAGNMDVYLIKTDGNGNALWTKTYGDTGDDLAYSVEQTSDGGYILAGLTNSFGAGGEDAYLIKTDGNGNVLWTKAFGGAAYENASSVQQTTDGGFIIAGDTYSFGSPDFYLIKTDSSGNLLWSKKFGGINQENGRSVQQTTDGGYIIAGVTISFGAGGYDFYLVKTDSSGNSGCNEGNPATVISTSSLVSTNPTSLASSGGITGNTPTLSGSGGIETTLCLTVGINENNSIDSFMIYPNPFSVQTTLQTKNIFKDAALVVYNSFGEEVRQIKNISGQTITLNRDNLSGGLYFIRLTEGNETIATDKLIITN